MHVQIRTHQNWIRAACVAVTLLTWPYPASAQLPICTRDEDCSDGLYCNGAESCRPGAAGADARGCVVSATPNPCGVGQKCNESGDFCEVACTDADGDGVDAAHCGGADCNDADPSRYPGNTEVCDPSGHDEDCDATSFARRSTPIFSLDDFRGQPSAAAAGDQDGDGFVSAGCFNTDVGGQRFGGADCDDNNPDIHPTEAELCNGVDDNCNGQIDEGLLIAMYPDADGDGYGQVGAAPILVCSGTPGLVTTANDCDDANPAVFPGSSVCSGSTTVSYCAPNGQLRSGACDAASQSFCLKQPNGAGICVPSRPAPQAIK